MPSNSSENALALAIMVIGNWIIAHLVTDWVMPTEVQSSAQTLLVAFLGTHFDGKRRALVAQDQAAQRVLAAVAGGDSGGTGASATKEK